MNTRGRPKKNGLQPSWMLQRVTLVVYAYGRAREAGDKHFAAIQAAVRYVRKTAPGMPVSETEVRRILAVWRSNQNLSALSVTKPEPPNDTITLPNGRVVRKLWTAALGPRPIYPRANAAPK